MYGICKEETLFSSQDLYEGAVVWRYLLFNFIFMKPFMASALIVSAIFLASCGGPTVSTDTSKDAMMQQNEKTVEVGGAAMYPSKNIIENAMNSADHTTLVAAVKAAGLVETLE